MKKIKYFSSCTIGTACGILAATAALGEDFNIPGGDLKSALDSYARQAGVTLVYSGEAVKGAHTKGARGELSSDAALEQILSGTDFAPHHNSDSAITIVRRSSADDLPLVHLAAAPAPTVGGAALETVTVTSSKIGGDVQNIPISITALSQEQLTATQTAGGPDLVKQVPNKRDKGDVQQYFNQCTRYC